MPEVPDDSTAAPRTFEREETGVPPIQFGSGSACFLTGEPCSAYCVAYREGCVLLAELAGIRRELTNLNKNVQAILIGSLLGKTDKLLEAAEKILARGEP